MIVAAAVGVAAVVVRFTHSSGEERLQLKWFAAAALLVIITIIPSFLTDRLIFVLLASLALLCLWVAVGIAVLKYRLYGIDIVISKAVLYGSLAVCITAVYAGLVVGVGALAGGRDSPLVAALAAAVVAVAFQPVRQRAGRLANRVVYGRRATPLPGAVRLRPADRRHLRGRGRPAADGADRGGGDRRRAGRGVAAGR